MVKGKFFKNKFSVLLLAVAIFDLILFILFFSMKNPNRGVDAEIFLSHRALQETETDIYKDCLKKTHACFEDRIRNELLSMEDIEKIVKSISVNPNVECHTFMHFVGREVYKLTGSVAESYDLLDYSCHSGALHGVIEGYFSGNDLKIADLEGVQIIDICKESSKKSQNQQLYTECIHGMGHAFMFLTDSNLPLSLEYCDLIPDRSREVCWGGVFMENSTSATNFDHPSKWLSKEDKFYPCNIVSENHQGMCYYYQADYLLRQNDLDYKQVLSDCQSLASSNRAYCDAGIGLDLATFASANLKSPDWVANWCLAGGTEDDVSWCMEGLLSAIFNWNGLESSVPVEICNNFGESLAENCFAKYGQLVMRYSESEETLSDFCSRINENYLNDCLGEGNSKLRF